MQITQVPPVKVEMLIRRPAAEVFQAFFDPAVTTKFWYTKSSGKMTPGAQLVWEWEMYGAAGKVSVLEVEENRRILFEWPTRVELLFVPSENNTTIVEVTESAATGDGDEMVAHLAGSTSGFTTALCSLKALLEHGIQLGAVGDRHPKGVH